MNTMQTNMSQRTHASERGIVLVVTLLFAVTVLGLAVALTYTTTSSLDQRRRLTAKSRAVQAADSGMHHVVAALNGSARPAVQVAGGLSGTICGDADSTRTVRYEVRLEEAGQDGFDNDLDGYVDEPDEQETYEAAAVGYCDDTFVAVGATVRLEYPATITSAMYFSDPTSKIKLNGDTFRISGYDVDGSRVATGLSVPAVGVAGDKQYILDQIESRAADNFEGSGGSPSVQAVPRLELDELIGSAATQAQVVLSSGSTVKPGSPGAWGTLAAPATVYGAGDIHVSGGATGAGLLVVDGALTISGSFEWFGLVVVRGTVTLTGGGSGQRLTGALVVDKKPGSDADQVTLPTSGTVDILYSAQTIALVMKPFSKYTTMNWREAAVPPSVPQSWLSAGLISTQSLPVLIAPLSSELLPLLEEPITVEVPPITVGPVTVEVPPVTVEVPPLPKLPLLK
jgi:hypothetical protein